MTLRECTVENNSEDQHLIVHSQSTDQHLTQKHPLSPPPSLFYSIVEKATVTRICGQILMFIRS